MSDELINVRQAQDTLHHLARYNAGIASFSLSAKAFEKAMETIIAQSAELDRFRFALMWARDRIDVDSMMTKAEAERTASELLNVLRGLPSDASSFRPMVWESPTLAALQAAASEVRDE